MDKKKKGKAVVVEESANIEFENQRIDVKPKRNERKLDRLYSMNINN
jgi:hypothetical protein